MPPKKNTFLLISFFVIAFYASSSGYADKTFMPKEVQNTTHSVTEEQLIESSVNMTPEPAVTEPVAPTAVENESLPNHPKRYVR